MRSRNFPWPLFWCLVCSVLGGMPVDRVRTWYIFKYTTFLPSLPTLPFPPSYRCDYIQPYSVYRILHSTTLPTLDPTIASIFSIPHLHPHPLLSASVHPENKLLPIIPSISGTPKTPTGKCRPIAQYPT